MDKKTMGIIVAVVVAIVIIAAAAVLLTKNGGKDPEPEPEQISMTVYLQDVTDNNLHKVMTGKGETKLAAVSNAFSAAKIDFKVKETGWVDTINGKGTTQDSAGNYTYWILFVWDSAGKVWKYSETTVDKVEVDTVCFYYGSTDTTGTPSSMPTYSPADNRTLEVFLEWGVDHDNKSAKGANALYAAQNAIRDMGVECTMSSSGWVTTINGMGTTQAADGSWVYWILFVWDSASQEWKYAETAVAGIADNVTAVCYLYGATDPVTYLPTSMPHYTPQGKANTIESTLMILGNANKDYTIDAADLAIVNDVIAGTKTLADYPFADANADGKVDAGDRAIVQDLVDRKTGSDAYVWTLDRAGDWTAVKVSYPLRNVVTYATNMQIPALMANGGQYVAGYFSSSYDVAEASLAGAEDLKGSARAITDTAWANFTALDAKVGGIGALLADYSGVAQITDKYAADLEAAGIPLIMYGSADAEIELYTVLTLSFLFGQETESYGLEYVQAGWDVIQKIRSGVLTMSEDDLKTYMCFTMYIYITGPESTFNSAAKTAGGVPYWTVNEEFAKKYTKNSTKMSSTEALAPYTDVEALINNRSMDWGLDAAGMKETIISTWDHSNSGTSSREYFNGFEDRLVYVNNMLPAGAKLAYMAYAMYPELFTEEWANEVLQDYIDMGCVPFQGQTLSSIPAFFDFADYQAASA